MSVELLGLKKLRITSVVTGDVVVIQDGSAADATADLKVDDGFALGYAHGGLVSGSASRIIVTQLRIRNALNEGRGLTFGIQDFAHANQLNLAAGDLVEFWCDHGTDFASTDFPSWHGAELSGQQRIFVGHIDDVQRLAGQNAGEIVCQCVDTLTRADLLTLQQSKDNGSRDVAIPYVVFNCDDMRDPDWHISIKGIDRAQSTAVSRFGTGRNQDPTESKMNLEEILQYLEDAYRPDLYGLGLLDDPADDIFDATEIANFSGIEPPKTVFAKTGFATALRQLVDANLHDWTMTVDHRSRKIRFVPAHRDMIIGDFATITAPPSGMDITVSDPSLFATSGNGSRVRLQSVTDPHLSTVATVTSIASSVLTLNQVVPSGYASSDRVLPMYAVADAVPFISIANEAMAGNTLQSDLKSTYTAVNIVSRKNKRERVIVGDQAGLIEAQIRPGYHEDFGPIYRPAASQRRYADTGVDGNGLEILEITTHSSGTKTRVYFSELQSAFGADHVAAGSTGEWVGTSFHVLTVSGQATDVSTQKISAVVEAFAADGWVDAPTNTEKRFRLDLDRDITATASIQDVVNDAAPDLFELTSSPVYGATRENGAWMSGRVWRVESTSVADDARDLDSSECPPQVYNVNGPGTATLPPTPGINGADKSFGFLTLDQQNAAVGFNPAANPFAAATMFFLPSHPKHPSNSNNYPACDPQTVAPEPAPTVELDKVTLEVFSVRAPASGFFGTAFQWYSHQRELILDTDALESEDQYAQFQVLADAILRRVSQPHWSGDLNLIGAESWISLLDLGFRLQMPAGPTGYASGFTTELSRFWGLPQFIEIDIGQGAASLRFDSDNLAGDLARRLIEKRGQSQEVEVASINKFLEWSEARLRCLAGAVQPPSPYPRESCSVLHGQQSLSKKVTVIDPKQSGLGTGENGLGSPGLGSISSSSQSGSLGPYPIRAIESDYAGGYFHVDIPSGAVGTGTVSGSHYTPSTSTPAEPVTLPGYTSDTVDAIFEALLGGDLQTPGRAVDVVTTTGSTTTVIELATPIHNDGRYDGGFIEFRPIGASLEARPRYEIASHDASSVTLSSAMSESVVPAGAGAKIWPQRMPTLDATDFPNGGRPFIDADGNWAVLDGSDITPATLSAGVLTENTSSPPTPTLEIGNTNLALEPQGAWDFSGATVTGLATGSGWSSLTTVTAGHTASAGEFVYVDTSSGDIEIDPPASATAGQTRFAVKKKSSDSNVVSVNGPIDGAAKDSWTTQHEIHVYVYGGVDNDWLLESSS